MNAAATIICIILALIVIGLIAWDTRHYWLHGGYELVTDSDEDRFDGETHDEATGPYEGFLRCRGCGHEVRE